MKLSRLNVITYFAVMVYVTLSAGTVGAEENNPYMGAPVEMGKAANGAIALRNSSTGLKRSAGSNRPSKNQ